jgi:hypothetical protein
VLAFVVAVAGSLAGCRPACELPEGEVLQYEARPQIARPGLDASLRKCLAVRGIGAGAVGRGAEGWSRFVRGDGSALDNDAKLGALLVLRDHECPGCNVRQLARAVAASLSTADDGPESRYLAAFGDALGPDGPPSRGGGAAVGGLAPAGGP